MPADCTVPPDPTCQDADVRVTYSLPGECDPQTGACRYQEQTQTCSAGCLEGVCKEELGEDFGMVVPTGMAFCQPQSAIVTLRPGLIRLPRDQEVFAADLVESVQLGPDGRKASAATAGIFTRGTDWGGYAQLYEYTFRQSFLDGLDSVVFELIMAYGLQDGVPTMQVRNVMHSDRATLSRAGFPWLLLPCNDPHSHEVTAQVCLQNGDRVGWTARIWGYGNTPAYCVLLQATLARGAEQRIINDFHSMNCSCGHHCFGATFMAKLNPPWGEIHQVRIVTGDDDYDPAPATVSYINGMDELLFTVSEVPCQP